MFKVFPLASFCPLLFGSFAPYCLAALVTSELLLVLLTRNLFSCLLQNCIYPNDQFSSVTQLCLTLCDPVTLAQRQASLSITYSQSPPKPMSIESAMPSNHLILCLHLLLLPQSLPASGSFPMSQLFAWGGQSTGVSASASVLPMNTQDWSLLGWTGWISLQSKGLSRVFSNTRVQKHQFFGAQLSLSSNSHIHMWPLEKPYPWPDGPLLAK